MKKLASLLFIYNPRAGRGQIKNELAQIVETARNYGYATTVIPTKSRRDAIEILKVVDLDMYERVLCCGGDGTLAEIVNGLINVGTMKTIGYIPAGSTNDFAATLQLPKDFKGAAEVAIKGKPKKVDIGQFNDKYFVYIAAFGIFTDVSYSTDQALKNVLGHLAYVLQGAKELSNIKPYHMKIEFDDGIVDDNFILGMISSTTSVGGILDLTPLDVALDDGYYEVVLIKAPKPDRDLSELSTAISNGEDLLTRNIIKFKASYLNITSYDGAPWTIDGEYGGNDKKITIKNLKQKAEIAVQ